ncbi:MAG: glycoside hydrolase family 38 C-terminal domain-containing protein [Kiritimatiellia bacterium]|jgi:alpha-mannosidase|nr:glycoside hydrolase family 38 C-terminal domain-containing protein [Kiritimatiellia bacterium]MDP7022779.1 glycoside hydrolase family 38 C-terminal domain-containing protein [Kiritimatiellia bacterium]
MSLTIEWRSRIDHWRAELGKHFYRQLGSVEVEGFVTAEQLSADEAAGGSFVPMPKGSSWGGKWEYAWFRTRFTAPEEAEGRRLVAMLGLGHDKTCYLNGKLVGEPDGDLVLSREARAGETFELLVESYAGHGPRVLGGGPVPIDRETVPEPAATQESVGDVTFGIWEEDAFQLHIDVESLAHLRDSLDQDSLRVQEIDEGLRDFSVIVDLELPQEEKMASIRKGRERLQSLLECTNGSTAPTMYAIGHGHLDIAWLWPLAETERKIARTLSKQLAIIDECPEHKFLQPQPHLLRMVQNLYPELWERLKLAVASGNIIVDGGSWVECDTNVSGGEALIRQFIHGKRYFKDEFDFESEVLWLPDVFGYSGAMPQIMRGCGVKYFATAKIYWNYNGGDSFPRTTFVWEGIDGSEVFVNLMSDYNSMTSPKDLIGRWTERPQKDGYATRLFPFGYGDGGGGPHRMHVEFLKRAVDLEGCPRARIAPPIEYFRDQDERGWPDVRYVGELYCQVHRGVMTSQAKTKKLMRQSELALRETEIWGVAAAASGGSVLPESEMDEAWKVVLLNQFHDILPGSSIQRVHEQSEEQLGGVVELAGRLADKARSELAEDGEALTLFNSLSWNRSGLIKLPEGISAVAGSDGEPLPVQTTGRNAYAEVSLPSCGWTTVKPIDETAGLEPDSGATLLGNVLENEHLRVEFGTRGEITKLFDKDAGRELAAAPCNEFRMYKDVPSSFDAWDIDSTYMEAPVELSDEAVMEPGEQGPLVASLKISRTLHGSAMSQEVSLRRGSRTVEFKTVVDWQERHKLLKVAFPVTVHANEAIHEIQFGHIARPNHFSRQFDEDRFEVTQHKWTALVEGARGAAVLNDCKYGVNVLGNSINLTLLRSPLSPDMTADLGRQEFTYAFHAWNGPFAESAVVQEGYELNVPVTMADGDGGEKSLFNVDAPNVIIEAVKPAEDGSGDIVVRLYEAMRSATRCRLTTSLNVTGATVTDMLEQKEADLELAEGGVALEMKPFGITTVRFSVGQQQGRV